MHQSLEQFENISSEESRSTHYANNPTKSSQSSGTVPVIWLDELF